MALVQRELAQYASKQEGIEWELSELRKRQDALARKVEEATARRAKFRNVNKVPGLYLASYPPA